MSKRRSAIVTDTHRLKRTRASTIDQQYDAPHLDRYTELNQIIKNAQTEALTANSTDSYMIRSLRNTDQSIITNNTATSIAPRNDSGESEDAIQQHRTLIAQNEQHKHEMAKQKADHDAEKAAMRAQHQLELDELRKSIHHNDTSPVIHDHDYSLSPSASSVSMPSPSMSSSASTSLIDADPVRYEQDVQNTAREIVTRDYLHLAAYHAKLKAKIIEQQHLIAAIKDAAVTDIENQKIFYINEVRRIQEQYNSILNAKDIKYNRLCRLLNDYGFDEDQHESTPSPTPISPPSFMRRQSSPEPLSFTEHYTSSSKSPSTSNGITSRRS